VSGHYRLRQRRRDRPPPLGAVFGRGESLDRNVDELRVTDERVAVGERQLESLGDQVDVLDRVVLQRPEVVRPQDVQRLGE
jgi:hypothetical protein